TAPGDVAHAVGAPRGAAWYRAEADRLAHAGRYAEAIRADFLGLVMALDDRRVFRYRLSKTPREYFSEAPLAPEATEQLADLIRRLYRFAFAETPCGPEDYLEWRRLAQEDRLAPAD